MEKIKKKEMTEAVALKKLCTLCARGEHSEGEMLQKMRLWGIGNEAQARIMKKLVDNQFVDDERYCRMFINDKLKFNQWGRRKIEQALIQKGISRQTYQPMLNEIDSDRFVAILQPLIEAKRKTTKASSPYELKMKLMRFAMSRGFEAREINICIDEIGIDDDF